MKQCISKVTDREADDSLRTLTTGRVVRATDIGFSDDSVQWCSGGVSDDPPPQSLPPTGLRLLRAIIDKPMQRSSEYATLAGMSPNTVNKVRPILIEEGLIRAHKLESGKRGRAAILLEPLETAKQLLAKAGDLSS